MLQHYKEDVFFAIPNFAPLDLVERCGPDSMTKSQSEITARVQLVRRLRDFEKAVESTFNAVGRTITTLHGMVRSPDRDAWSQVTTVEATRLLDGRPNAPIVTTFAVHKHLMHRSTEFVSHPSAHRSLHVFEVTPLSYLENMTAVRTLVRQGAGALASFASTARQIITASRARAIETRNDPPALVRDDRSLFSDSDLQILTFLMHSLRVSRASQEDPYAPLIPAILKSVGLYEGTLDVEAVYRFLVELGLIAPWDDPAARDHEYSISRALYRTSETEEILASPTEDRALAAPPSATVVRTDALPAGPEDFYARDPLESVRHDFGDLPVYIIDDFGAQELDDGVSYEPIPHEPESAWLHVHIADPTAVIPPSHVLADRARSLGESAYFIHKSWSMLPSTLLSERLSLGVGVATKEPQEVLTFSIKVDARGAIVDYKVRAGIIRNRNLMKYDDVDHFLGTTVIPRSHPFNPSPPVIPNPSIISESQIKDLRGLYDVAERLLRGRLETNMLMYSLSQAEVSVTPTPLPTLPVGSIQPAQFRGFPDMTYSVGDFRSSDMGARFLVGESMRAAGRVASRFCTEHGIPALRRAGRAPLVMSDGGLERLRDKRDSSGWVDYFEAMKEGIIFQASYYTLDAAEHWAMGIAEGEGYVRVTSPLRRYGDLFTHWQIKHALLPSSRAYPLFPSEDVWKSASDTTIREARTKSLYKRHNLWWVLLYVKRQLEGQQRGTPESHGPDLLNPADAVILDNEVVLDNHNNLFQRSVYLPALGLQATLHQTSADEPGVLGESLKVKVKEIDLGMFPKLFVEKA